jgi:hypothetical protein
MRPLLAVAQEGHWLMVTSVSLQRRNLALRFELFPAPTDETPAAWLVSCHQVREFGLADFDGGGLDLWETNHPMLSQFSSPKASLKITIDGHNPAECAGVLLHAHRQAVDDWIDVDRFAKTERWVTAGRGSVVLSGPEFLLFHYHRHLVQAGFTAVLKKHKRKLYWSGFGWSERRRTVSLLHFGNSFVVAESFSATPEQLGWAI